MRPTEKQQRIDRFFAAHRERGLPVTTQRRAVFEAILDRRDHPTAEQVYRAVLARTPPNLPDDGPSHPGDIRLPRPPLQDLPPRLFRPVRPQAPPAPSPRLPGLRRIIDVEDPRLNQLPWPKVNLREFQIEDYHVHFRGRCARCRQKPRARQRRP